MSRKETAILLILLAVAFILGAIFIFSGSNDPKGAQSSDSSEPQSDLLEVQSGSANPQGSELGYSLTSDGLVLFTDPDNALTLGVEDVEWDVLPWEEVSPANLELFEYAIPTTSQGFEWPSSPINGDLSMNFWGFKLLSVGDGDSFQLYNKASATQAGIGTTKGFSPEVIDRARQMPGVTFYTLNGVSLISFGFLEVPAENYEGDVVVTPFDVLAPPHRLAEAEESWGQ